MLQEIRKNLKNFKTVSRRSVNSSLILLSLIGISLFGLAAKVYAEQVGSSPSNVSTSRIKSIYDILQTNGYGSDTDAPNWGMYWNRIKTASTWKPNGTLTSADVLAGKTFYNGNRIQQTGSLSLIGTATPADVASGKTFYSNSTTQQTGTALPSSFTPGNCPSQVYHDSYGEPVTQTTNCTNSIVWTIPSDGIAGSDKRDPVSGLIWSQPLVNTAGTIVFTSGVPSVFTWSSEGTNNLNRTATQLCSDRGDGWRLPNQKELMQAYIDGANFSLTRPSNFFWSATQSSSTNAWIVGLSVGTTYFNTMTSTNSVRCVR